MLPVCCQDLRERLVGIATYHDHIPRNTIKSDEESSLVDKRFEIFNLDLVKGLKAMVYFIDVTDTQFDLYTPRV